MMFKSCNSTVQVGVKLLVAYKVVDPSNALAVLGKEGIVPHIEVQLFHVFLNPATTLFVLCIELCDR